MTALGGALAGGVYLLNGTDPVQCDASTKVSDRTPSPSAKAAIPSIPDTSKLDAALVADTSAPMRRRMETYVKLLQSDIVTALSALEPSKSFVVDSWKRKEGGEGISCVLQDGQTFDKAGVNISIVHGMLPPAAIKQMKADHSTLEYDPDAPGAKPLPFFASGLSVVIHPNNPHAPTVHFNYRYFEVSHPHKADGSPSDEKEPMAWWFGGGTDLTPSYLYEDDVKHFHGTIRAACDAHDPAFYPAFKRWCDKYFFLKHRNESRGVGGIFFDDLTVPPNGSERTLIGDGTPGAPKVTAGRKTKEELFSFVRACGDAFLPSYLPILTRRILQPYDETQKRWQQLRRGRYVEFNLVYDRGTKFGLQTPGARIESILMSLPTTARWEYMSPLAAVEASDEAKMTDVLMNPRDWA